MKVITISDNKEAVKPYRLCLLIKKEALKCLKLLEQLPHGWPAFAKCANHEQKGLVQPGLASKVLCPDEHPIVGIL